MDPEIEETSTTEEVTIPEASVETPDTGDDFDAAFAEATGTTPAPKPAEKVEAAPTPAAPETEDPNKTVAPEVAAAEKEAPATTEPAPAAQQPAPAPAPAPAKDEVPANLDPKFLAQAIAEEQQRLAENKQTPAEPAEQKVYTATDFIAPETQQRIDKFKTEWPDEFPAIEAMIEARAQALFVNGQNSLIAQLNPLIAGLQSQLAQVSTVSHTSALEKAHPDVAAITPKVVEWVKTQPTILQPAYQNVLQNGDAKSIIELLDIFKASTGQTGAAPNPASSAVQESQPAAAAKKPVPPATAAALAAVPPARRAQPTNQADPSDYNAAFEEAIAAVS